MTVSLVDGLDSGGNPGDSGEIGTAGAAGQGPHITERSAAVEETSESAAIDVQEAAGKPDRPASAKGKPTKTSVHLETNPHTISKRPAAVSKKVPSQPVEPGSKIENDLPEGNAHQLDNVAGTGEGAGNSTSGGQRSKANFHRSEDHTSAVDKVPELLRKYEPVYPDKARRLGISGKVVVKFVVEPDGHISRPCILESHPVGIFEQSALDAIVRWRFKPGYFHGKPVATWVVLPFEFQLT